MNSKRLEPLLQENILLKKLFGSDLKVSRKCPPQTILFLINYLNLHAAF